MSKRNRKLRKARLTQLDKVRTVLIIGTIVNAVALISMCTFPYMAYRRHLTPEMAATYMFLVMLCFTVVQLRRGLRKRRLLRSTSFDDHIADVRASARDLFFMGAFILAVSVAFTIYVSGLYQRMAVALGPRVATLLQWTISGIIGNAAFVIVVRVFRLGPLVYGPKAR
jgi:hypothetical protein